MDDDQFEKQLRKFAERMMRDIYRRDGTSYPQTVDGMVAWARDFEDRANKIVRQDHLANGYVVSTVWLGMNHNWGQGPPLIFETMVFRGNDPGSASYQRYATENDAIVGHMKAVDAFKAWPSIDAVT